MSVNPVTQLYVVESSGERARLVQRSPTPVCGQAVLRDFMPRPAPLRWIPAHPQCRAGDLTLIQTGKEAIASRRCTPSELLEMKNADGVTVNRAADELTAHFQVDRDTALRDAQVCLVDLVARQILIEV